MKVWPLAVLFALAAMGGCKPPPIARGTDCVSAADCHKAREKFNAALRSHFPVGSSQAKLERELVAQGFQRDPKTPAKCLRRGEAAPIGVLTIECPAWDQNWNPRNRLVHRTVAFPICGRDIDVWWSSGKAGNLTHVEGFYSITCL